MAQQQQMGLFGPTPTDILRAQQAADQDLALRQAQLAPGQGLIYQAASAGQRAGRNIAGLFGIEDPALKEATEMDAVKKVVASQWDGSDPEKALELFVQEANKRGLTQQALSASERLTKMKADKEKAELGKVKTSYEIGKLAAQTQEAIRKAQQATAAKLPSLVQHQEARDAIEAALQTEQDPQVRTRLETRKKELDNYINKESTREPKDKTPPSVGSEAERKSQAMFGKPFGELTQEEKNKVDKAVEESSRGRQSINIDIKQGQGINAAKVKRLDELEQAAVNADSSISNVSALNSVLGNAFTGVGSGAVLKAGQIANAFGIQVTGTSETEQLNQLLAKLAQGQARTLPGSLSEKELMFLREAIGTGGMTRQTLQAMLNRMRVDAIADKEAYKDAFAFQRSGGNLNDYDFATNRTAARRKAQRMNELLEKATPEQRRQLGY
jgi:hypothetical protein